MKRFCARGGKPPSPAHTSLMLMDFLAWDGRSVPSPPSTVEIAKGAFVLLGRIPRTQGIQSAAFSLRSMSPRAREDTGYAREQGGGRESRSRGSGACITSRTNHSHKGHEGIRKKDQQPKANDQKPALQIILLHQMSERAVGNFQQIRRAGLNAIRLGQGVLQ